MGRMLNKVFKEQGVILVNIVRKEDQIQIIKEKYGCEYVLNSSRDTFQQELNELSAKIGIDVIIDAVSGDMAGKLA